MKNRVNQNKIRHLISEDGVLLQTQDVINEEITTFYSKLLGTTAAQLPAINPNIIKEGNRLDRQQQLCLTTPVTKEEVVQYLKDINDLKASGCDDYNAVFFQKSLVSCGRRYY